jgi:hypothetical protein
MNEDLSGIMNKLSGILKDKNIDVNQIINTINSSNNNTNSNEFSSNSSSNSINNNLLNSASSSNSENFNIDIDTILKLKDIVNQMNKKNIPRNNLLNSLKPFLRKEKQDKLDEYIKYANLLNLIEILHKNGDENNDNESS